MNEVFEELFGAIKSTNLSGIEHLSKSSTLSAWRRIFKKHNLTPRRYLAILHLGNGHYAVESESRAGIMHSVDIAEHGCSCENKQIEAKKRKLPSDYRCKHMQLIERLISEGLFPATK